MNNTHRMKATQFQAYADENGLTKSTCKTKLKGGLLPYNEETETVCEHFAENWDSRTVMYDDPTVVIRKSSE